MSETSLREYCGQIENTIEQGRYVEAVAHGKHILKQYPRHVDTYRLLGKAMLEAGQDEYAVDMFRRVLSADPEDLIAWVGLSEVHNKHNELDAALWYLERAFELATDSEAIAEELRGLYSRRDGVELQKTPLTTGALARLYLKGDLLSRAINDLRALLAEHPERMDLRVALAEALWRNDQRLEASEVCQQVLDELPYCLKTNLILGNIWASSGREEGQVYLQRAEALDPENKMAQQLFGDGSPLPARQVRIAPLEYGPSTGEERPAWMAEVEGISAEGLPLTEKEAALVGITAALEAQIEIPSWLEEIAVDEKAPVSAPPSLVELPAAQPPEEAIQAPAEEIPAWLATGIHGEPVEEQAEAIAETQEETPEWLTGLGIEPIDEEGEGEGEVPVWLAELGIDTAEGAAPAPGEAREEETREWLAELGVEAGGDEAIPTAPTVEQAPDWLSGLRDQFTGETPAAEEAAEVVAPAPAEIPDWLQELAPPEAQPQAALPVEGVSPAEAPAAEEAAVPAWLERDAVPSGDEALAWLEQLAEGKEEKLQAQIQAEAETRMAEIMGRPAPAEPPPEEVVPEEPTAEVVAPAPAEIPDWLQELAPPVEEVPPVKVPAAEAPVPAWLEGDQVPSGDEALAWLEQLAEGKEEELRAQIQAEGEARMAEIMGRPAPAEPPPEEIALEEPPETVSEKALAAQVKEALGWTAFGEPEAQPAPAPPVEEVPPAKVPAAEVPVPAWLEGDAVPSGDEALAWLEQLAEGKEEELQAQIQAEGEARMAEIMGRPAPAEEIVFEEPVAEMPDWLQEPAPPEAAALEAVSEEPLAAPVEEAFGWTAFGEPEVAPPVEEALPPETITIPTAIPPIEEIAPPPLAEMELPAPPEEAAAPPEIIPPPVLEAAPGLVEMEAPEPAEEVVETFAAERAYLKENPRDYDAWLALARALWQANEREKSLEAYSRVIRSGKLIETVIPDLEGYLERWPDVRIQQVLGDAYMKDGQLQEALDLYRRALETL